MVRKFIALSAALLFMAAMVSCNNPSGGESDLDKRQAEDGLTGFGAPAVSGGVVGVQYLRTGDYSGATENFVVISSKAELEEYDRSVPYHIGDAYGNLISNGFTENIAKYTDVFFADNFLVIVHQVEPSGSIRHSVQGVDADGKIAVSRVLPEVGTDDIGSWHIIIELDNDYKLDKYNVEFIDAVPTRIPTPVPVEPLPIDTVPILLLPPQPPNIPVLLDPGVASIWADYGAYYDYFPKDEIPYITIISSNSELEKYVGIFRVDYSMIYPNLGRVFTDDFFKESFLVVVFLEEGSGTTRHKVEKIGANGDIVISRVLGTTDDLAAWNIIIPISNDYKLEKYKVVLYNTNPVPMPTPPAVEPPTPPASGQSFKGTKWKLYAAGGGFDEGLSFGELEPKDCERCYTLVFDTDSTFVGFSTVNTFRGVYKADYAAHNMTFEVGIITEVYDGSPDTDNLLFEKILGKVSIGSVPVTFREGELIKIYDKNNPEHLVFRQL